ncbi:MAG: cobalamin biosynthesis protein CobG [Sphingobium sp.]|uniref:cobalamin biosynthesis protein CobG n=1 Tax=Sphingobium sp. TaxID=1912891 RepID=UPI000DB41433|nr:cobalamin biosynthesis protein CobG [Sphingobium sp.]PZU07182.1 MAG: cobalamin biosynthesis protein CobG [Sphingobium sp.]
MSGFVVKGWCPNAWRPMPAGDGLLVRVKPRLGRMTAGQVLALCKAALAHGNGLIDLTRRANLQLRGLTEAGWPALIERLITLDLVDGQPAREGRQNLLVTPDWQAGDDTHRIASEMQARLNELPEMPGKMGFVIDAGAACQLRNEAGDFRIERGETGGLILRADGRAHGVAVEHGREAEALITLAHWFVGSGGTAAGRMVRHRIALPDWASGTIAPAAPRRCSEPGTHALGMAYGLPFGRVEAQVLAAAVEQSHAAAVRVTPWRVLIFEYANAATIPGLLNDPADPLLHVDACPGAPACPQATVATRDLARALAPHIAGPLHVSGCAKGCARSTPADVTLTGRDGLFDLALNAAVGAPPLRSALAPVQLLHHFGAA